MSATVEKLRQGLAVIRQHTALEPELGLILGSGLGFLADRVTDAVAIDYKDIPGFPISTVEGHAGRMVLGLLNDRPVAIMQGRFHYYEGYSMSSIAHGVRMFRLLGAKTLIVTNAAGGIRDDLKPGDLMVITDHINLMGNNPLIGPNLTELGPRFPDMSHAYSPDLQKQAMKIASALGLLVKQGVYAALTGPSYETPAEIRMLKILGADVVGMSTIPEVIAASHVGMNVVGVSCISNLAAGISSRPLSHGEVTQTAARVRNDFTRLVLALVAQLDRGQAAAHKEGTDPNEAQS